MFVCGNTKSGMSKLPKTTTPRSKSILDTVIQKVHADNYKCWYVNLMGTYGYILLTTPTVYFLIVTITCTVLLTVLLHKHSGDL